jgi:GNAT superfamily N-acetyltransferase
VEPLIREFTPADYDDLAALAVTINPEAATTADSARYRDRTRERRVRLRRLVAEADGRLVAMGQVMHIWWNFHPRRYVLRVEVDPAWQGRGLGSALFDRLWSTVTGWNAELVRANAAAAAPRGAAFLERRGFHEWRRRWDSVLIVADAETPALEVAAAQVQAAGIEIATYAERVAVTGEALARALYALEMQANRDEPAMEASGELITFAQFAATELDLPTALPAAHFLAFDGPRVVGVSRLAADPRQPDVLHQAFTGIDPAYRGRGVAQALKLRTIAYARAHGAREIRTVNDSSNAPMIHINDAIGFRRAAATVVFERRLAVPAEVATDAEARPSPALARTPPLRPA